MRLVWHRAAVGDVEAISDYIRHDSPAAARTVVRRLHTAALRLAQFPLSGRAGLEPGTRELVVTRIPYVIVYRVVEQPTPPFVEIIGIFHGARDRAGGGTAEDIRTRLR